MGATEAPADPTRPSPRERRLHKTRRAILDAARELIEERGYDQTTIDQIADRADIAPRTFFRYFPSKEALLFADLEELRQGWWAALDARPEREAPLRSVVAVLADQCDVVEANHDRLAWGFRVAGEHPGLAYEMAAVRAETIDRLGGFIAARLGVDASADPRPSAWAVSVMGVFSAAMAATFRPDAPRRGTARESFLSLVDETAAALRRRT